MKTLNSRVSENSFLNQDILGENVDKSTFLFRLIENRFLDHPELERDWGD